MPGWADDPELLATFRAEVEERVASLSAGLLQLESHPSPRQVIGGLFRDAHTVKGSARMLGLDGVLQVAHRCEDLLGGLRDGRLDVRRDIIDVLLAACDGITSAMPGIEDPVPDEHLQALAAAADAALALNRLVAVADQLAAATRDIRELVDGAHGRLAQVRDGAMGLAMVPVRRVAAGLPRVVRDVAAATGKDVRLVIVGEDVEL